MYKSFFLIAAVLLASVHDAYAGTQEGTVTEVEISQNGVVSFVLSGSRGTIPSCASGFPNWVLQDSSTTIGKQQVALLLTAQAFYRRVYVNGTSTCHSTVAYEKVDRLIIHDD